MELFEWTQEYVKFRNVMLKKAVEVTIDKNQIIVIEKESKIKTTYFVSDDLTKGIEFIKDKKDQIINLVCLNTSKNVDLVEANWFKLIENEKLVIIFVEPNLNVKWLLKPHIHNKIIDSDNLKEGLVSLHKGITLQ